MRETSETRSCGPEHRLGSLMRFGRPIRNGHALCFARRGMPRKSLTRKVRSDFRKIFDRQKLKRVVKVMPSRPRLRFEVKSFVLPRNAIDVWVKSFWANSKLRKSRKSATRGIAILSIRVKQQVKDSASRDNCLMPVISSGQCSSLNLF